MKYKLFTKTAKYRDSLQKDILKAKKSIYIEMYIFVDDTDPTYNLISALIQKANEGTKISLVLDTFGSRDLKKSSIKKMRAVGIEIFFFSNLWRRIHKKIIIIDDKIVYFGGANIHGISYHRFDMQMKIKGKKIIKPFLRSFAHTYEMCGGKNFHIRHHKKNGFIKKIKSFIIENLPGHKHYSLTDYYKDKLISAKKNIKISTPYFIPPRRLIALLDNAQRRGVKVEIIVPQSTDISSLDHINRHYMDKLIDIGISFYLMKHMNHSKILIVDDNEGLVGSQNLDHFSFKYNMEFGVFFKKKVLVQKLVDIFDQWKKKSIIYTPSHIHINLKNRIIGHFLRLFFYFM